MADVIASDQDLQISILSSSSARDLKGLIQDVQAVSRVHHFDLLIPRPSDLGLQDNPDRRSKRLSYFVADEDIFEEVSAAIHGQLDGLQVVVPALATYFPTISSMDELNRREAVDAIVNCFRLAKRLSDYMPLPIVEIVCGTTVEVVQGQVHVYRWQDKFNRLCQSLTEVIERVSQFASEFAISLELEPGEIYLLNDFPRLKRILEACSIDPLNKHVGLNVDIAHMRIVGVSAEQLHEFLDRIVHAHISDHPGIHTHDQFVGSWTNVEQLSGGYQPYINLLRQRMNQSTDLPFSRCIAIELEGCNRIFTIHDSVTRLRHALALSRPRSAEVEASV